MCSSDLKILEVLPALNSPTISELSNPAWVAVNTILEESCVRDVIPRLKAAGATGIVVVMNGMVILFEVVDQFELNRFAKWRGFIAHHFSSPTEFHLYCFILGIVLMVAGFSLMRWHKREEKRFQALVD